MPTDKQNTHEPAKKQPEQAKIVDAQELSDDELEEVSGGLISSGGTDGGSCVTA